MTVLILYLCLASQGLWAQVLVEGRVIDGQSGDGIPGVNISISGSVKGGVTDLEGEFSLYVEDTSSHLTFSSIGYRSYQMAVEEHVYTVVLEPTLLDLGLVVVSAGGGSQMRTDAPLAISKLQPRTLHETKPVSLDQALNKVNGLYMVNLGNEQHSMSIRQPLSLKSLFLYLEDGIPLRPTGIYNHNALIEINMAALQSIEVIRGPASSAYGSEAIGGSINFISRDASFEPNARVAVQGDNLGYKRMDFEGSYTVGKTGMFAGGYYANRTNGYREHSDFHKLAFTLRANHKLGEKDQVNAHLAIIDYDSDMSGSIDSTNFYSKNYPSLHTFTNRQVRTVRATGSWEHFWNDRSKTNIHLLYRNNLVGQNPAYRVRNDHRDPFKASGEINEQTFQSVGAIIRHAQEIDFMDARLVGGASVDYSPSQFVAEHIEVDRNEKGEYTSYQQIDSLLTHYDVGLLNMAVFGQFEINPFEKLKLIVAGRYDHYLYDYKNHLTPDAFSGAPDSRDAFNRFSPKVGFTYDFEKGRGIYGNFSTGFVPPQVSELYRGVKVPVLEPSHYDNLEIGGWWPLGERSQVDFSIYQLKGMNEIISVYMDDGTTENRNAGRTMHRGIEYSLHYNPSSQIRMRLGGTNALHEFIEYEENGNSYDGKRMNAAPGWIANAEMFYYPHFLGGFRVGMEWQHLSSYFMDAGNTEKYKGFDVLNLRMAYEFGNFEIWGNMMNLTDALYATNASKSRFGKTYSPGDPRTVNIGVAFSLSKSKRNQK